MIERKLRSTLLATAAASALLAGAATQSANAALIKGWNLNLALANGLVGTANSKAGVGTNALSGGTYSGLTNVSNIDHMVLDGFSTVMQNFLGGSTLFQTFTEKMPLSSALTTWVT